MALELSENKMRAVIWTDYGSPKVLLVQEVPKPPPQDDEVLVRIHATSVSTGDCEQRSLKLTFWYKLIMRVYIGFRKPTRITILGMDFAGEIEAIGKEVKRFQVGDQVFASTDF